MSLFVALGVGLGFVLMTIPNVELISTTIFISGYILGIREGIIVGILTEGLYSLLNPMGMAAPPLFIALVFAMGCTGLLGGLYRKIQFKNKPLFHLGFGLAGLAATVNFSLWTTFSYVLIIGLTFNNLLTALKSGIVFSALHIVSNTIIFSTIVPLLIEKVRDTQSNELDS